MPEDMRGARDMELFVHLLGLFLIEFICEDVVDLALGYRNYTVVIERGC